MTSACHYQKRGASLGNGRLMSFFDGCSGALLSCDPAEE